MLNISRFHNNVYSPYIDHVFAPLSRSVRIAVLRHPCVYAVFIKSLCSEVVLHVFIERVLSTIKAESEAPINRIFRLRNNVECVPGYVP